VPETKAEPEPEPDYEEPEIIDEEAEIERRRKRREEILAKSSSATPLLLHAVGAVDKTRAASPATMQSQISDADPTQSPSTPRLCQSQKPTLDNIPSSQISVSPRSPGSNHGDSPGRMDLTNDKALMNTHANGKIDEEDGPSAADYDPTVDMREDERRHGQIILHGESHVVETTEQQVVEQPQAAKPAKAAPVDADDDDDFDMFAEDFDEEKFTAQPAVPAVIDSADTTQANDKGGILEGDDKDGYYKIRIGEVLFSGVVRAVDMTTKQTVAIKIMRNNDALRKGGYTEIAILEKLNAADPDNKKHIVKFERSFDYKGHLCMAFENLSLNLREVLRKFGNNVGINLPATRIYAYQFFVSLDHMQRCSIIHADLKPDNILVSASMKLSDGPLLTCETGQRTAYRGQDC
jgi:serine/threonine-protein kinase PRP4